MTNNQHKNLIDIGANLTNKRFHSDLEQTLVRAREAGLEHILITGTSAQNSYDALTLSQRFPDLLSTTAGVHPHDAKSWSTDTKFQIQELLNDEKVLAVGECGLDFNRDFSPRPQQAECFREQLEIACDIQKPVFLHERDAHEAFVAILSEYRDQLSGAVVHCFTGNKNQLQCYLDMDCHIGITGWVCDERRGKSLQDIVKYIPADRLMIETDAPYLTPRNMKSLAKGGRNEPAFLSGVVTTLAELRGVDEEQIAAQSTKVAKEFFKIP